ncbi:MAG: type II CAAX endopeptidase family protein, partial [Herbinix sp.]|nr:type II CAAX endopeptidase family protein [Herbinix sp.]
DNLSNSADYGTLIQEAMSQDILYLISVIGVVICGIVFFFWYQYEIKGEIRGSLRSVFTGKHFTLLIFMGIGCQFFVSGSMSIIQQFFKELFADYAKQVEMLTSGNDIVVLLLLIIIAPVTEELIFRGVILHKTSRYIPFMGANILQAILFGLYHQNIIQGIYAAIIAFLLGFVYYKFKTIFASMLLHMIVNASSLLLVIFPQNYFYYCILILVGIIFSTIALCLLKLSETLVPKEVKLE